MFFSNTNRTNLTNLVDCDPVYIRGIREICGQLNIIHTRICFFRTLIARITRILQVRGTCFGQYMLQDNGISKDNLCKDIGK